MTAADARTLAFRSFFFELDSMQRLIPLLLVSLLAACQNPSGGGEGGFYVYTDAQGNLITVQQPEQAVSDEQPGVSAQQTETSADPKSAEKASPLADNVDDYRPSGEVDKELEARENDRFITYVDETGQLVSRPLDMGAEREAVRTAKPGYEPVGPAGYLETYRALRADCCQHFLDQAKVLEPGHELLVTFDSDSPLMKGDQPYRAMVLAPESAVTSVSLMAFIRKQAYLGVELLWLDDQGIPVMLVDQPFSRRYPETWYRYGYLQGTLEKDQGQHYLVVFLPYLQGRDGTDGLKLVTEGELVLTAQ
ncbi:MAG: hypothetical protein MI751_05300 [Pseudomonadales bacterium]|nr:hypothetical protein [Pseudomonadales bacterium]